MSARLKPEPCVQLCPLAYRSLGFCSDWVPERPSLAFVVTQPTSDDVTQTQHGHSGMFDWFEATLLAPNKLSKKDVIMSSVYRCYNQTQKKKKLKKDWEGLEEPITGWLSKQARTVCRMYDNHVSLSKEDAILVPGNGLVSWGPNCFFVSFALDSMRQVAAMEALGIEIVKRAKLFSESGYRPCVLMGDEAFSFVAPWLAKEGGHKNWLGHWWEGEWPKHDRPDVVIHEVGVPEKGEAPKKRNKKEPKQGSLFQL